MSPANLLASLIDWLLAINRPEGVRPTFDANPRLMLRLAQKRDELVAEGKAWDLETGRGPRFSSNKSHRTPAVYPEFPTGGGKSAGALQKEGGCP